MSPYSLQELAIQAEVDNDQLQRFIRLGAVERRTGAEAYGPSEVRRIQLLRSWEAAGFPAEAVLKLVRAGELSMSWLDSPVATRAQRLDVTCEEVCEENQVPLDLMQQLQSALGLPRIDRHDRARVGDRELLRLVQMLLAAGAGEGQVMGMIRVYADSLHRIAKAEAQLYEREIEEPLRRSGWSEQRLLELGGPAGGGVMADLEGVVVDIYRRQREHVWVDHCISHAETVLERAGLRERVPRPPAICFVDLTGYTRITEEHGDEVAAQLADNLASMVHDVSLEHGGEPIRWLGDGGMFHFKEPEAAVLSGLDMNAGAPRAGLPAMHIGIHTGPVIFQGGDVFGKTVNLASRIASYAGAGQVLASDETVARCRESGVRFEALGEVRFKGITRPVTLHRAVRSSS